jgi:uncharacterized protein
VPGIAENSTVPARRHPVRLRTRDGLRLVGEWSLPQDADPATVIVLCHPLPTHGGSSDSHLIHTAARRLPALAGIGVLRFNTRGTSSSLGTSEGAFEGNRGEGHDLRAAIDEAVRFGATEPWAVGWSFGADVILRWGNVDPVAGAVLLSPPGLWSDDADLATWAQSGRPVTALVPEFDELAGPDTVRGRFATVPQARIVTVGDGTHLWMGERCARAALDGILAAVQPAAGSPPTAREGPMQRGDDPGAVAGMADEA